VSICSDFLKLYRHAHLYALFMYFCHSVKTRAKQIFKATKDHSLHLAAFVSLYKSLMLLQRKMNGGKERKADTFIAGLIGGYVVFGDRTAINEQIVLYVCSRVVASFIPRAGTSSTASSASGSPTQVRPIPPDAQLFSFFAALSWGAVMYLFKNRGETIQSGMFNSMKYLYRDSEHWNSLKTLLWHNK